jgi:hypothetical protein
VLMRLRVAIVGLVLIALLATAAANTTWATTVGIDLWNLPDLHEDVRTASDQNQVLDTEYMEASQRIRVKEEMISSLIAGRSSLAEVATQFTVINEGYENHMIVIRQLYPGATDQEKMLWNVLDYAYHRMAHLPAWRRLAILARLQAEFQSLSMEFAAVPVN